MTERISSGLKRFIFWDYARATWQYDVMVGIILIFVFLTPREWFRDQPRIPHASNVAMLPSEHGSNVFWIDPELLSGVPEEQRVPKLIDLLKSRTGKKQLITGVEPIYDSEHEIKGYMAFTRQ